MGGYDLIITKYQKIPVITSAPVTHFSQAAFHEVDSEVTGLAFDIQNELGRFLGEKLYQAELVRRLRLGGFDAEPEMKIIVRHGGFEKHYLVDILVDAGVIVETKAVESIGPSHRSQLMNYLYLCDLNHGTLLNFRKSRVQKRVCIHPVELPDTQDREARSGALVNDYGKMRSPQEVTGGGFGGIRTRS